MSEADALEQVLTLLGHAKIAERYKDESDAEAENICWKLLCKLRENKEE